MKSIIKSIPKPIQIAQIVAISKNRCIGKDNDLPWHLPKDLQHFKHQTTHNTDGTLAGEADSLFNGVMVMGRKTFESMRSRPLPKRVNIIITRQADYSEKMSANNPKFVEWLEQGKVIVTDNLDTAIEVGKQQATQLSLDTLWVIGGGEIFRQSLPITERIELTQVDVQVDGDAFYPAIADDFVQTTCSERLLDEEQGLGYQFLSYQRR